MTMCACARVLTRVCACTIVTIRQTALDSLRNCRGVVVCRLLYKQFRPKLVYFGRNKIYKKVKPYAYVRVQYGLFLAAVLLSRTRLKTTRLRFKNQKNMSISIGLGTAIGGGLAALGGLSSAAVSAGATTKLNKVNRDWQEKMYSRKLADAREDYMRNVYYNSTQYKVKDMRAAGLNPNGSEAPVTGAVSQSSNPDVPSPISQGYDTSGIAHGFASAGQILSSGITRSSELQIAQQNANTAAMDAATRQFSAYSEDLKRKSEIGYIDSKTYGQELSNAYNEITFDNRVRQTEETLNQIQQNTAESLQRTLNLEYDRLHLKPAQVAEINTHIAEMNAAISDYQSLAKYRAQLISESAAKTDILKIEKQMKDIELQWLPSMKEVDYVNRRADLYKGGYSGLLAGFSVRAAEQLNSVTDSIYNYAKRSFERARTFFGSIPRNKSLHQGYIPGSNPMIDTYNRKL